MTIYAMTICAITNLYGHNQTARACTSVCAAHTCAEVCGPATASQPGAMTAAA